MTRFTRTIRTDNTARVALNVTTDLTDREACELASRIRGNNFAASLVADFRRYGRLFPNKLAWLHKLALEQKKAELPAEVSFEQAFEAAMERHLNAESQIGNDERFEEIGQATYDAPAPVNTPRPVAAVAVQPVVQTRYPAIVGFLTPVSGKLKSGASVTVENEGYTVEIKRAKATGRHAGCFWVTDGKPFGQNTLYGRIDADGLFTPYAGMRGPVGTHVEAMLAEMEQNPGDFCARVGKRQGRCCFCNITLDDPTSITFGYGPICAKHYGLPHGKRAAAKAEAMRCEARNRHAANAEAAALTA